jgi:hypothetical protein
MADITIGSTLPNGATVLQVRDSGSDKVILAFVHGREFATWIAVAGHAETFWGHYFASDLAEALADYNTR